MILVILKCIVKEGQLFIMNLSLNLIPLDLTFGNEIHWIAFQIYCQAHLIFQSKALIQNDLNEVLQLYLVGLFYDFQLCLQYDLKTQREILQKFNLFKIQPPQIKLTILLLFILHLVHLEPSRNLTFNLNFFYLIFYLNLLLLDFYFLLFHFLSITLLIIIHFLIYQIF